MAGPRLVIVDDEPVILRLLTSMFDKGPYEVVACATGREGRAAIDAGADVVLTDKNLPDIGGLELLEHAKRTDPFTEVLLITGFVSIDTVLKALQMGAFDYIVKPPSDIFQVKRKVEQAFEKVHLARENADLLRRLQVRNADVEHALEELQTLQAELVQSEKLAGIGTLAAGIAHEISSPLFGIMGLAEAIIDEEEVPLVQEYAREIVDYSKSIRQIVQQLSGYSRASEGAPGNDVVLHDVVNDAVRLVHRTLGAQTEQQVQVHCPAELLVRANANELQQVFVNLVKNGLEAIVERHGDRGAGCLTIRAIPDGSHVAIEITDDGAGIPAEKLAMIFDPFFTTKAPGRGTGLGLNIVYRILTKFRGSITVESEVGVGTTFRLRVPTPA